MQGVHIQLGTEITDEVAHGNAAEQHAADPQSNTIDTPVANPQSQHGDQGQQAG